MHLEDQEGEERQRAAEELRDLLGNLISDRATAVSQVSVAVAGNIDIHCQFSLYLARLGAADLRRASCWLVGHWACLSLKVAVSGSGLGVVGLI